MSFIYLDHAATTPVAPQVREAMLPYLQENFGNPSSLHQLGKAARQGLEQARQRIAGHIKARPESLIFTSGGTEANNLAILGIAQALKDKGRHIITSCIEHAAVLNPCRYLETQGWEVTYLPVDGQGRVTQTELEAAIQPDTVLASIMHGNNEVGTLQPIATLGELLKARGVLFHTDAIQTLGKLPLNLNALPVDYLSMSAHKIYGPKGVGALYCRENAPLPLPLLWGGGQEQNLRSGTENLAGIIGFSHAVALATERMAADIPQITALQEQLISEILASIPEAVLNGPRLVSERVPGNVHFSFPPLEGESLVLHLDMRGIGVSSGSACHSAQIEPSHVVLALGKPREIAQGTVRFSLGRHTTADDIAQVVSALPKIVRRLTAASL